MAKAPNVCLLTYQFPCRDVLELLVKLRMTLLTNSWVEVQQTLGVLADKLEDIGDKRLPIVRKLSQKSITAPEFMWKYVGTIFGMFNIAACPICRRIKYDKASINSCFYCCGAGYTLTIPINSYEDMRQTTKAIEDEKRKQVEYAQYLALKAKFEGQGSTPVNIPTEPAKTAGPDYSELLGLGIVDFDKEEEYGYDFGEQKAEQEELSQYRPDSSDYYDK